MRARFRRGFTSIPSTTVRSRYTYYLNPQHRSDLETKRGSELKAPTSQVSDVELIRCNLGARSYLKFIKGMLIRPSSSLNSKAERQTFLSHYFRLPNLDNFSSLRSSSASRAFNQARTHCDSLGNSYLADIAMHYVYTEPLGVVFTTYSLFRLLLLCYASS